MDRICASACALYNAALEEQVDSYRKTGQSLSMYDQAQSFTQIRTHDPDGWGTLHVQIGRGV